MPASAGLGQRYDFYRLLRSIPANADVRRRDAFAPTVWELPRQLPGVGGAYRRSRRAVFVDDARRLNDALAGTALAGRYWVWSGVLLGWAREGRLLPGDADLDLAFSAADDERFASAVPALLKAGFRRWFRFVNNDGQITEETFVRGGAKFEFYRMTDIGRQREYHMYGTDAGGPVQLVARVPRQQTVPFEFLGRTWYKAADHEAELEAVYGDWRTPDPDFDYLDECSIVARCPWAPPTRL
jgi:hypothetical protein